MTVSIERMPGQHLTRWALRVLVYLGAFLPSVCGRTSESQSAVIQSFHHASWTSDNDLGAVFNVHQASDGFLWLTTSRGVLRFDGVRFKSVEQATFGGVQDVDILSTFESSSGRVWFTMRSTGVLRWKDRQILPFSDRRCTPAGLLRGMVAEEGDVSFWFESTSGLAQRRSFALSEGAAFTTKSDSPPVVITSITGNGKVFPGWKDIIFPQHTRNLEVDYTALSLFIPQRMLFRYKLEGYDKELQDAGTRRQVFYTGLPPRHYGMRVIACKNDGIWNDIGASLNATLQPAFYQTIWFLALCGVLMLIAAWRAYMFRVERLADAMRVRFNDRLNERTRLAHDLHDTLLQTIQAGKLATDQALGRSADRVGLRIALERLSDLLGRAAEEGRAALSALHISSTETNDLARALRVVLDECLINETMQVDLSIEGKSRDMHPIARDEVYRIAYEAIRNARAHSEATLLKVQLVYARDLTLRVLDNGKGIDPSILKHGKDGHYGLSCIRERAARIGAILEVSSTQPGGTTILLTVAGKAIFLTKVR